MEDRHPATITGPITETERTYAIELLETTREALRTAIAGLSEAQQHYKPAPDRWSILECVEHIVLVENGIFGGIRHGMDAPANADKRADIRVSDLFVIKAVRSRGATAVSPAKFEPTGQFADVQAAFAAFDAQRSKAIEYVKNTSDDFRTHYFAHFVLGTLDAYQTVLLLASHGERHRKQIDEVKATPGFPE